MVKDISNEALGLVKIECPVYVWYIGCLKNWLRPLKALKYKIDVRMKCPVHMTQLPPR